MEASAVYQCTATREDGQRCEVRVGLRNGLCFVHDPERRDAVQDGRSRGADAVNAGRRSAVVTVSEDEALPPPQTLEDCARWTSWATWAVAVGKIDGRTAHEIGALVRELRLTLLNDQQRLLHELQAEARELRRRLEQYERGDL